MTENFKNKKKVRRQEHFGKIRYKARIEAMGQTQGRFVISLIANLFVGFVALKIWKFTFGSASLHTCMYTTGRLVRLNQGQLFVTILGKIFQITRKISKPAVEVLAIKYSNCPMHTIEKVSCTACKVSCKAYYRESELHCVSMLKEIRYLPALHCNVSNHFPLLSMLPVSSMEWHICL